MSVNSKIKATKIIAQRKAFYRQRIQEFSRARNVIVDIDVLATSGIIIEKSCNLS